MLSMRLGPRSGWVHSKPCVAYRRGRDEMPAHDVEVDDALREGVGFMFQVAPVEVRGDDRGGVAGLRCQRMTLGEPDESGRRRPEPVPGSGFDIPCDVVIAAVGIGPAAEAFDGTIDATADGRARVDSNTLQGSVPWLFAAGDAVTGASDIARAVGQGRRAAFMIDRWLQGLEFGRFADLDDRLAAVDKADVLARQKSHSRRESVLQPAGLVAGPRDFAELESPITEEEARAAAGRCLDCGVCSECHQCIAACPANAIDLNMREEHLALDVGAVVVATGYGLFPADLKPQYGYGRLPNVITGVQMERLLAPTRPYTSVLRPSDGKIPVRIAYVMCTGSRDESVGNPLCSKFCCMYSLKQNQLIMGVLRFAEVTVHYVDIRAVGKGYDEFFEQAKAMGASFIKGRVAGIRETEESNLDSPLRGHRPRGSHLRVRIRPGGPRRRCPGEPGRRAHLRRREAGAGRLGLRGRSRRGLQPGGDEHPRRLRGGCDLRPSGHPGVDPPCGSGSDPGGGPPRAPEGGSPMNEPRIAVYVCQCGGNIGDYVDVDRVIDAVKDLPGVCVARRAMFTCSDSNQQDMIRDVTEEQIDRFVVACCSPKLHTFTFRGVAERAGLNPYQVTQVNIREQCSWTHTDDPDGATRKATRLVNAGVARARLSEALHPIEVRTSPKVAVIGAGVAGMRAAISLADVGLGVYLIEREADLGGWVRGFGEMFPRRVNGRGLVERMCEEIARRPAISVFTNARLISKSGTYGSYQIVIGVGDDRTEVTVGQIIVATGFDTYQPDPGELGYGGPGVVTLPEFRRLLDETDGPILRDGKPVTTIAYIYCVGSRNGDRAYCSRYCCTAAVHAALLAADRNPTVRQYHLYRDMRTYGRNELLFTESRKRGSYYLRFADDDPPAVSTRDHEISGDRPRPPYRRGRTDDCRRSRGPGDRDGSPSERRPGRDAQAPGRSGRLPQ